MEKEIIKKDFGFSLIETTLCLLLTSIITIASFNLLRNQIVLKGVISNNKEAKEKADIFFRLLENHFHSASILNNIEGIKIHSNSKILDQNGNPVSIGKSNKKIRPNINADAISFLSLNTDSPLENSNINQNAEEIDLCLSNFSIRLEDKLKLSEYQYFYALYLNGSSEVKGRIKKTNKKTYDCKDDYLYNLNLIEFPKSIFSSLASKETPLIIFPIEESFTFYLDNNNTLRRFSLLTGENQPLLSKINSLKINSETKDGIILIKILLLIQGNKLENNIEFKKEFTLPKEFNSSYFDLVL